MILEMNHGSSAHRLLGRAVSWGERTMGRAGRWQSAVTGPVGGNGTRE